MFSASSKCGAASSQYGKADGNADEGRKILDMAAEESRSKGGSGGSQ